MELLLLLNDQSEIPLYTQAAEQLIELIKSSRLAAGSKLPSSRELSESLGISRCTASKTYEELARRGFITTRAASGTFVSSAIPVEQSLDLALQIDRCNEYGAAQKHRLSQFGRRILFSNEIESADLELHSELNYDAASEEQLPLSRWRELLTRASKSATVQYNFSDAFGHKGLRKAIASYLSRTRGLKCSEEQIVLFSGTQPALDLLSRLLINPGDSVLVENPGFPGARRTLCANGARLQSVPVDEKGIQTALLQELAEPCKLVYLTPAHHAPLGMALSIERRKQLLDWAVATETYIIEDDFDSEFRYGERAQPAFQAMDSHDTVIFLSSFWKLLCPLLRLGFMVLPPPLVHLLRRARSFVERDFQTVEHEALSYFIDEGHLERHIRRTRAVYARRREQLVSCLYEKLGGRLRISSVNAGTHLLVRFKLPLADQQILSFAEEAALPMVSTESYYYRSKSQPGEFLIPFAHLNESQISNAVQKFADLSPGAPASSRL